MLKAIAVDDEPLPLELLQAFCAKTDFITLEKTFTNISEAQHYLQNNAIDLLFLDIQMPKLSGIEFYKSLLQECRVIFTTAHSQFAIEGFNLNAVDYLLKPFSFERFLTAAYKAKDLHRLQQKKAAVEIQDLYIRSEYSLVKISVADILLIESFADYLDIHLCNLQKITTRMSLKNIIEKLPQQDFMRVHRSYIVPLKRIERVSKKTIFIGTHRIPIGTNYEAEFNTRFPIG